MRVPDLLDDAVADWISGELRWRDLYPVLLDLIATTDLDALLKRLPPALRDQFEAALADSFDNDVAVDQLLWIDNAAGEHPAKAAITTRVRSWLARRNADITRNTV